MLCEILFCHYLILFLFTCKCWIFVLICISYKNQYLLGCMVRVCVSVCVRMCFLMKGHYSSIVRLRGTPVLWHSVVFKRDYFDTEPISMTLTNFCQKVLTHKWDGKRTSGPKWPNSALSLLPSFSFEHDTDLLAILNNEIATPVLYNAYVLRL